MALKNSRVFPLNPDAMNLENIAQELKELNRKNFEKNWRTLKTQMDFFLIYINIVLF